MSQQQGTTPRHKVGAWMVIGWVVVLTGLLTGLPGPGSAWGQPATTGTSESPPQPAANAPATGKTKTAPTAPANGQPASGAAQPEGATSPQPILSEAERIASLQRSVNSDEQRILELQKDLDDPQSAYAKAETEFKALDEELGKLKRMAREAEDDGNATLAAEIKEKITPLEKTWEDSKRRFDLEIESRRTRRASLDSLKVRLASNKELLEKLRNPESQLPTTSTPDDPAMPAPQPPATTPPATEEPAPPTTTIDPLTGVPTTTGATPPPAAEPAAPKDSVVLEAESLVEERRRDAAEAQAELDLITERIESLKKNIELERRLRDLARQKSQAARADAEKLRQEYWRQLSAGEEAIATGEALEAAIDRQRVAEDEARSASNHLDELQSALALVQNDQMKAMRVAEDRRIEMEQAQRQLDALISPWARHRIERWLTNEGLRIIGVLLFVAIAVWGSSVVRAKLIDLLVHRSRRGTIEERQNRARTLVSVFQNAFITFVYGFAAVVVLESIGYSVAPLLGGAAVLGLAVAFGAQSLIKDYFTGFIVLLEQQYMLGDVVRLGGIAGQVERITLRMTVLRDLEGCVHFIPHGQITSVTNMTHGWSRALFDIQIAYSADVDRATRVLMELAREMRRDPAYAALITEEPAMLGVDALGNSGVTIKFHITTRPLQQWTVKRELLRRIKLRFDEEGIEIPFPQLTLHTRHDDPVPIPPPPPPNPLLS